CAEMMAILVTQGDVVPSIIEPEPVLAKSELRRGNGMELEVGEVRAIVAGTATALAVEDQPASQLLVVERLVTECELMQTVGFQAEVCPDESCQALCDVDELQLVNALASRRCETWA